MFSYRSLFYEAHYFRSEIFLFLFNAFAQLITNESLGFGIVFLQQAGNGFIRILDEFLVNQANFLVVLECGPEPFFQ